MLYGLKSSTPCRQCVWNIRVLQEGLQQLSAPPPSKQRAAPKCGQLPTAGAFQRPSSGFLDQKNTKIIIREISLLLP